ncbi:PorP/SprF family type IX secretion system membrane protein [Flavisolibacter nicotianae]|uniref:PorP/SprF family type IX secretion system membrane protein n=1 Tax=Flavisolibacter nicotianae TaxID=2364882 RepID=UPI000EB05D9E|nr:PorP/SprF family type IX secretion system membrane protein [Flavisolibacter nicotianae]
MKYLRATGLRLLALICCVQLSAACFSQDIHFSQFFEAPLLRNPSLAGIFSGDIRVQMVYRDQWNSVTTAYKTASVNGEYKMPVGKGNDFVTAGLQLLQDRAGAVSWVTTHVLPALNYHKSLSEERTKYLSVGFMGGWVQNRFDRSRMTTNTMYDGNGDGETFLQPKYSYWDASAGMSYNAQLNANPENNFYVGVAYHHFNKPKNSVYKDPSVELSPKADISAGIRFAVADASYITIQANQSFQGGYKESIVGALYGVKLGDDLDNPKYTLHGGAFFRVNDALIPVLKMDYNPFSFSVSYDVNISQLRSSSYGRGGFELGLSYVGFTDRDNSTLNAVVCPKF